MLKSTAGAAGITALQVDKLAESISNYSGMDDEAVQSGENMLLTFTNIRNVVGKNNDIFNQATRITADLSVALGIDMSKAALQVGKALNDPLRGMSRLQRIGVAFTESQKEQVKAMQEAGNVMGGQRVILAELTKEFGGSAKAAGETLPGQLKILRENFNNLTGEVVGLLVPGLEKATSTLTRWVGRLREGGDLHDELTNAVGRFRAGLATAQSVIGTITAKADDFADSIGGWDSAIAVVAGAMLGLKATFLAVNIFMRVQAAITATSIKAALITTGIGAVAVAAGIAAGYVVTHWTKVRTFFVNLGSTIREKFLDLWDWLRKAAINVALAVVEPFSHLPGKLGGWARAAKRSMQEELVAIDVEAAFRKAGDTAGMAFFNALQPWTARAAQVLSGVLPAAAAAGGAGAPIPGSAGTATARGSTLTPPTSFMPTHKTEGPGWGAVDIMVSPGTPVGAPENGTLTRITGHNPSEGPVGGPGGPWGRSFYFIGDSGTIYYGTHLSDVAPVGRYSKGDVIGIVGNYPGRPSHLHWSIVTSNKGYARGASTQPSSNINVAKPKATGGGKGGATGTVDLGGSASVPDSLAGPKTPKVTAMAGFELPIPIRTAIAEAALTTKSTVDDLKALNLARRFIVSKLGSLQGEKRIQALDALRGINDQIQGIEDEAAAKRNARNKAALDRQAKALAAHLERLKKIVADKRKTFEDAFANLAKKALDAFDRETQAGIDRISSSLDAETDDEKKLREFRAQRAADERARRRAEAEAIEDPAERAKAIRELDLEDEEAALEAKAEASRKARDEEKTRQIADWENQRAIQRSQLDQWLTEQGTRLETGKTQWTDFWDTLVKKAGLAGADVASAFWQEFASSSQETQSALGGLSTAEVAAAVLPVGATVGGSTRTGYVVGGVLVQPKMMGQGGIVRKPTLAIIGEAGPEEVRPLGAGGSGNTYNFHFPNYVGSRQEIAETIRRELLATSRYNRNVGLS